MTLIQLMLILTGTSFIFVVLPLVFSRSPKSISQKNANVVIYQDRLRALEEDVSTGQLSDDQFALAKTELDKEVLADTEQADIVYQTYGSNIPLMLVLLLLIPLGTFALYQIWGHGDQLQHIELAQKNASSQPSPAQAETPTPAIEAMVEKLAERLKTRPDDAEGWVMLGRSYSVMKQYPKALAAYEKAYALLGDDPDILVTYADVAAKMNGGDFTGKPAAMITRALAIDPNHPKALLLAGFMHLQTEDFAAAIASWERMKIHMAGQPQWIETADQYIASAKARMLGSPEAQIAPPPALQLSVDISDEVKQQVSADAVVFIFAKAKNGPPMPLGAIKTTVSALPGKFQLGDAQAVTPRFKISDFTDVSLSARIALSGTPGLQAGDFFAESISVKNDHSDTISLVINQQKP